MSTRSFICKKYGDKYKAIYCHFDGYPKGVGAMLEHYYIDDETIDSLIDLGDISYIGKYVSPQDVEPTDSELFSNDVTFAYHRDRGEEKVIREFSSFYDMLKEADECWCDFLYYWNNGCWDIYINTGNSFILY